MQFDDSIFITFRPSTFCDVPVRFKYEFVEWHHVLDHSFVLLPGIGLKTERRLWENDVLVFEHLIDNRKITSLGVKRLRGLRQDCERVLRMIDSEDYESLAKMMPKREMWRFISSMKNNYATLDVESIRNDGAIKPVLLTICDALGTCTTFVRGDDLAWQNVRKALRGYDFLLTFNGSSFDLPLLERHGFTVRGPIHIDLRRFTRRAGLNGGLKKIERTLGIARPRHLEFSTSAQVSYLWRLWEGQGSKNALDLLIDYNQQDAKSLIPISRQVYKKLFAERMENLKSDILMDVAVI